jgi:hypothetical protein
VGGGGGFDPSAATALDHTFLIMLGSLVIAAALMRCVARRTYPPDVATAIAAEAATASAAARERTVQTAGTGPRILQPHWGQARRDGRGAEGDRAAAHGHPRGGGDDEFDRALGAGVDIMRAKF